ncbi:DME family drug/metabolite transporter [Caldalkalibacillus uzonensis]|uniref:DME family drug/metabolite transporter n=1 Tax=Caldalkalibacillus uzonensis TaxID=353224 RepID=A0ABU0CSH4_9BACI|nr:EamA family transporter [Caldalkalibacillus uzonensis]MDQ0339048.1 DME family drug/metabolite transporter [Caldalkalibacillus uzonensis]
MDSRVAGSLVLLAAVLWGTTGTAQAFAPQGASPLAIGAMRLAVGGLALLCFVLVRGTLSRKKAWPLGATLIAAVSMALYQPLFFSAVASTGVAVGTVVAIGSAPILAGMFEYVFRGVKPGQRWWLATALAVAGCVLLLGHQGEVSINIGGLLMALGAGFSFAVYTLVSKGLLAQHRPEEVVAVVFSLSAVLLSPLLLFYDLSWLLEMRGWAVVLHLGLVATALAYLLFVRGLTGIPAAHAVTLSLAEPLTAALLGIFLVGEILTLAAKFGIALLFLGLSLLTVRFRSLQQGNVPDK